jgi:hypothetical protein
MNHAAPKRTSSGNHPAVREFRRKLDSMASHGPPAPDAPELDALDDRLKEYLTEVKSDPPPGHQGG